MSTNLALADRSLNPMVVSGDQLDLVKKTVAQGATDAELKLYLYDCQRHGVHPLDKLLHFTKRGGKYTPVTSIDLMRMRAADTGECLGISDPKHFEDEGGQRAARVTVKRLVQGQVARFTATARWSEYFPGEAQGHMWKKMPHTMLGKCAEALALRKGFPKQLAGLYAREEMEQAAAPTADTVVVTAAEVSAEPIPDDGALRIVEVSSKPTTKKGITRHAITLSDGRVVATIKEQFGSLCQQLAQERAPVRVVTKETQWGEDLVEIHRMTAFSEPEPMGSPIDASDIPF